MRRLVEIGIGNRSGINFEDGDIYIGCDAAFSHFQEKGEYSPPPEFVESRVSELAIVPQSQDKTVEFVYPSNDLLGFILTDENRERYAGGRGWQKKNC